MIKNIVFDLDDTLYNERDFVLNGFKDVSKYLSNKYEIDKEILNKDMEHYLDNVGRGNIFNLICEKYDINEEITKLIGIYRNNNGKLELYKDASFTIKELKKRGYKLGLITDGNSEAQWNKIEKLNLEEKLDGIIVSDDKGREFWKPSIVPYMDILDKIGGSPKESIYIGDNPKKDFIGANSLGYKTIRIKRDIGDYMNIIVKNHYDADHTVNSLDEVLEGEYI